MLLFQVTFISWSLHILAIPGIQGIISCSLGRPRGLGNCKILHKFQDQEFREILSFMWLQNMFCSTINWITINISVLENIVHAPYIMQSWMMSASSPLLLSGQNRPFSLWGLNSQYLAYRIFCKSWTSETIDLGRRECFENICVALLSWPFPKITEKNIASYMWQ